MQDSTRAVVSNHQLCAIQVYPNDWVGSLVALSII